MPRRTNSSVSHSAIHFQLRVEPSGKVLKEMVEASRARSKKDQGFSVGILWDLIKMSVVEERVG